MMIVPFKVYYTFSAFLFFFFQAEDGIRDDLVTGVQTCALPISPFEIGAGINAGCRVSLKIDNIAVAAFGGGSKKMIERNFVQRRGRGERGNMPADSFLNLVRPDHHRERVPAHQTLNPALHLLAAR